MLRKIVGVGLIILGVMSGGFGVYGIILGVLFGGIALIFLAAMLGIAGYEALKGAKFAEIADILHFIP
jgi:hypothetical protein